MNPTHAPDEDGRAQRALTRRLSLVVVALSVIAPFSIDTYLPSLPAIALEFSASDFYLQQTLSLYLIAFGAMTLVYGPLSDTFGRRRVVLASAAVYVLSSIGCAIAANAHSLLTLRVAQGLAASGGLVVGRAIIRDSFAGAAAQRVMSRVMVMFLLAPAFAPVIGGWLHEVFGWRSVFWFLALLGTAVWVWVAATLPETLPEGDRHPGHPRAIAVAYGRALRHPRFMLLVFAVAFNFAGMFIYVAGSPALLYGALGLGPRDFSVLFVPLVAGLMAGAFVSGRIAGRRSHAQGVTLGFRIMLVAAALSAALGLGVTPTIVSTVAPVALYACGMALAMPNLTLLSLDLFPRNRGLASAVQSFVHTGGSALAAGLVVPLLDGSVAGFAVTSLLLCLSGFACWLLSQRFLP
jgi:DHA1 family bicyclomycin/chloramphenicol resistance-like MFS transporter